MPGLLDFLQTPAGQGLLATGLGAAASAGRGRGLVGNLGAGGLMGLQAYTGAQDQQAQMAQATQARELQGLQIGQLKKQLSDQDAEREVLRSFYQNQGMPNTAVAGGPGLPQSATAALPPEFQTGATVGALPGYTPPPKVDMYARYQQLGTDLAAKGLSGPAKSAFDMAEKFRPKFNTTPQVMMVGGKPTNVLVGEDGTVKTLDGFGVKPDIQLQDTGGSIMAIDKNAISGGQAIPKTGDPFKDLVVRDASGRLVPNSPLVSTKQGIAKAGATQVNVNADKSYFGNVAEGLAKNDVALIDAARSAPDRIASAQRVKQILAQNPITGTGAEARLSLQRALTTAGLVDGKDVANTEMLASTLASQTLDAIKTSGLGAGQGFTDKDRQFLERAKSGNIEMNAESLRRIADLNEQSARQSIRRGNTVIGKLRSSPEAGKFGQQLDLIEEPKAPQAATSVVRRGTYQGRKVEMLSDGTTRYAD